MLLPIVVLTNPIEASARARLDAHATVALTTVVLATADDPARWCARPMR
jgi:hypothetical protein